MILCCGEALIDMLPRQTAEGESVFAPFAGGAVFNTAIALGRLEAPAGFFSGLSTDLFGQMLIEKLTESRVDTRLCPRSDRPTTLAFVSLVDGQARYAFYDEATAGRLLSPADLPASLSDINTLFFGGISLVSDPSAATYEALMARAAPERVTMIDPNIRPGFITDAPPYRARLMRMIALADIVKLSDDDLDWLSGKGDLDSKVAALLNQGPKLVFITEGAKGAWGFSKHHRVFVPATRVAVADTVGAGDTFNAGLLAALHRGDVLSKSDLTSLSESAITEALALGVQAASITVSRAGANPPWAREIVATAT